MIIVFIILPETNSSPLKIGHLKRKHPGKLTWNPKMEVWKMIFLFNWVTFRFHVNFQGCSIPTIHFQVLLLLVSGSRVPGHHLVQKKSQLYFFTSPRRVSWQSHLLGAPSICDSEGMDFWIAITYPLQEDKQGLNHDQGGT